MKTGGTLVFQLQGKKLARKKKYYANILYSSNFINYTLIFISI